MADQDGTGEGAAKLTSLDVLQMLADAHKEVSVSALYLLDVLAAKEPARPGWSEDQWRNELITAISDRLEWVAIFLSNKRSSRHRGKVEATAGERADAAGQRAVNALRRILPAKIKAIYDNLEHGPNRLRSLTGADLKSWQAGARAEAQGFEAMLSTLRDFEPKNPKYRMKRLRRNMTSWHNEAISIHRHFEAFVGSTATAKNSPAVRFVRSALAYIGYAVEPAAIEQALRRRPKGDKSWISDFSPSARTPPP